MLSHSVPKLGWKVIVGLLLLLVLLMVAVLGLVWGMLDRPALHDLGADPAAQMAFEAAEGTAFASTARGELVRKLETPGGTHGQLPSRQGLEASFIAWGPHVKAGVNLHRVPMTRVGPTLLEALGIDDSTFGEQPPLAEIFK